MEDLSTGSLSLMLFLAFSNTAWEGRYSAWVFERHFNHELYTYLMKCVFDLVISQAFVASIYQSTKIEYNVYIGIAVVALKTAEICAIFGRTTKRVRYVAYQQFSFFISIFMIIFIGPEVNNLV